MKIALETGLLCRRRLLEQIRSPIWLFMGLTTPLLYLALFAPLLGGLPTVGGKGVADAFVPGLLALFALSSGTDIGWIINHEMKTGVIERFRVSPVSRFSLLMGNVLKDIVTFLLPISLGPAWLQVLAHLNTLYYVVEASRVLAGGTIWDGKVLWAFGVMIPLLGITLSWAVNVYRKAVV